MKWKKHTCCLPAQQAPESPARRKKVKAGLTFQSASTEGLLVGSRPQSLCIRAGWMVARCFRTRRRSAQDDRTFLGPGKTVRNAYPLFETSAVYEGQRATDPNKRVVILSRSAYTGSSATDPSPGRATSWPIGRPCAGRSGGLSFGISGFPIDDGHRRILPS